MTFEYQEGMSSNEKRTLNALWRTAVRYAKRLQAIRAAGYLVFNGESLLTEKHEIIINEEDRIVGIRMGNCTECIFMWDSWDWDTCKEMEEYFSTNFIVVQPLKEWPSPFQIDRKINKEKGILKAISEIKGEAL